MGFFDLLIELLVWIVQLSVIFAGGYLGFKIGDYRRFGYVGMSLSFVILSIAIFQHDVFGIDSSFLAMVSGVFLFISCALFMLLRAADLLLQDKGFFIKRWQKNKSEDRTCRTQTVLSVPPKLFRN